jgi:hypothetical protein
MMGLALTGAAAAVLVATMPIAHASRHRADLNNRATSLAQRQMEAILQRGFPNTFAENLHARGLLDSPSPVATDTFSFTNVDAGERDDAPRVLPGGIGRVQLVHPDGARRDIRRVTVWVQWIDNGETREVRLSTLVANTQQSE